MDVVKVRQRRRSKYPAPYPTQCECAGGWVPEIRQGTIREYGHPVEEKDG